MVDGECVTELQFMDGSNSSHSNRWYFLSSASALPGDKVSCQPLICITFIISSYLVLPSEISDQTKYLYLNNFSALQAGQAGWGICCDDAACESGDMVGDILSRVTAMSFTHHLHHHHLHGGLHHQVQPHPVHQDKVVWSLEMKNIWKWRCKWLESEIKSRDCPVWNP